jgi:hypothetical protein
VFRGSDVKCGDEVDKRQGDEVDDDVVLGEGGVAFALSDDPIPTSKFSLLQPATSTRSDLVGNTTPRLSPVLPRPHSSSSRQYRRLD